MIMNEKDFKTTVSTMFSKTYENKQGSRTQQENESENVVQKKDELILQPPKNLNSYQSKTTMSELQDIFSGLNSKMDDLLTRVNQVEKKAGK